MCYGKPHLAETLESLVAYYDVDSILFRLADVCRDQNSGKLTGDENALWERRAMMIEEFARKLP